MYPGKILNIFKDDSLVLTGTRSKQDSLWDVRFEQNTMNYIIQKDKSKLELAQYLQGCAFSLSISTFQNSINKGNFITWPGIQSVNFKKALSTTLATSLGHLDQERSNLQSTKKEDTSEDTIPVQILNKTRNCFYAMI